MSICKITVGQEKIDLEFGFSAHSGFIEGVKKYPTKFLNEQSELTNYGSARLLLCAYENYCMNRDLPTVHNFDTFMQYMKEGDQTEMLAVFDLWSKNTFLKKEIETFEKKRALADNSTLTTSEPSTSTTLNESATENLGSNPGSSGE